MHHSRHPCIVFENEYASRVIRRNLHWLRGRLICNEPCTCFTAIVPNSSQVGPSTSLRVLSHFNRLCFVSQPGFFRDSTHMRSTSELCFNEFRS